MKVGGGTWGSQQWRQGSSVHLHNLPPEREKPKWKLWFAWHPVRIFHEERLREKWCYEWVWLIDVARRELKPEDEWWDPPGVEYAPAVKALLQ